MRGTEGEIQDADHMVCCEIPELPTFIVPGAIAYKLLSSVMHLRIPEIKLRFRNFNTRIHYYNY